MNNQRAKSKSFEDLIVWQKARKFVYEIYKTTSLFPRNEIYGITSQLRRASVSITANIAEGFKKKGKMDKKSFMNIAEGSLEECRCYLILSNDLGYEYRNSNLDLLNEIGSILNVYSSRIE
jgi:four helix bundle protein